MEQSDGNSKTEFKVNGLLRKATENININPDEAFIFINQALQHSEDFTPKQEQKLYEITAMAYFNKQSYLPALDYYYKSLTAQRSIDTLRLHYLYNNIGCTYLKLGDTLKAKRNLYRSYDALTNVTARTQVKEKKLETYMVYSNLAVLEMEDKNYDRAIEMFHLYNNHSQRLKDTLGVISVCHNLSNLFNRLKQADSSDYYFGKGVMLATAAKLESEEAYLYHERGVNYSKAGKDSAIYYLEKSYAMASQRALTDIKLSSSQALADVYESKDRFKEASKYFRIANLLSQENMVQQNKEKIELVKFENDQKIKQKDLLADTKKKENVFVFGFILLILICLVIFLMFKLQKSKTRQRKAENEFLKQKMDGKNKELSSVSMQMLNASEKINATQEALDSLRLVSDSPTQKMITQIIADIKTGSHSFNKNEFEKLFIDIDEQFYRKLLKQYPHLTKNEIRLCAFTKMNFSAKDISALTRQSPNSILVGRSRLRKKLGLTEDQSLSDFLEKY